MRHSSKAIEAMREVPPAKRGKWRDFTGRIIGHWKVVCYVGSQKWKCLCGTCGRFYLKRSSDLVVQKHKQCNDCWHRKTNATHGHTRNHASSKTYLAWQAMLQRCNNPNHKHFHDYGGRGVKACGRWVEFSNFLKDMGTAPAGLSLERVNNSGNYEPGNCIWATVLEQQNNRRNNRFVIIDGERLTLAQAERRAGYYAGWLSAKLNRSGFSKEQIPTLHQSVAPSGRLRWALC